MEGWKSAQRLKQLEEENRKQGGFGRIDPMQRCDSHV